MFSQLNDKPFGIPFIPSTLGLAGLAMHNHFPFLNPQSHLEPQIVKFHETKLGFLHHPVNPSNSLLTFSATSAPALCLTIPSVHSRSRCLNPFSLATYS